jgi:uncharacterized membrane protein
VSGIASEESPSDAWDVAGGVAASVVVGVRRLTRIQIVTLMMKSLPVGPRMFTTSLEERKGNSKEESARARLC